MKKNTTQLTILVLRPEGSRRQLGQWRSLRCLRSLRLQVTSSWDYYSSLSQQRRCWLGTVRVLVLHASEWHRCQIGPLRFLRRIYVDPTIFVFRENGMCPNLYFSLHFHAAFARQVCAQHAVVRAPRAFQTERDDGAFWERLDSDEWEARQVVGV